MRKNNDKINQYRLRTGYFASTDLDHNNGLFIISRNGKVLRCIVSDQLNWDHVSVSIENGKYPPTWDDMSFIKDLFFDDEETVIQYHPPKSRYVNIHPGVLHMWRPHGVAIPLPPTIMV
jgi:hypothetical protein